MSDRMRDGVDVLVIGGGCMKKVLRWSPRASRFHEKLLCPLRAISQDLLAGSKQVPSARKTREFI